MKKRMKTSLKTMLVLLAILINFSVVYGQDQKFSKNSIKIGVGFGASLGARSDGFGLVHTFGYQREIWKDRLRFNPNFSFGHYSSAGIMDAPDEYFNSISLETNIFYDLIRLKAFSFVVAGGGLVNHTMGLNGTGGMVESSQPQYSYYVSDYHIGFYLGAGFRINSPNKRIAINIMPINYYIGYQYFLELHPKFELDIKL